MLMTRSKVSEKALAQVALAFVESRGYVCRTEVVVTLPDEGQVSIDILGMDADESLLACEVKLSLNRELEHQAMRLWNYSHQIAVMYPTATVITPQHKNRCGRLDFHGIGRWNPSPHGCVRMTYPIYHEACHADLLRAAWHASDGSIDPPAGSSSAKRATPERTQWEPLRRYLTNKTNEPWAYIRRFVPEMRAFTSAAAVKAIDKGECIGVGYDDRACPTQFFATTGGAR